MRKNYFLLLLLAAVFTFSAKLLWARDVEICVEDTDIFLPLEGAIIRSWDSSEYLCDAQGRAIIPVPDNRQVSIRASYPGYENGSLIIPIQGDHFTLGMRLGSFMESRELVIEAQRTNTSETRSGRSVAISDEALTRTAETGLIEDVMSSVKLLPGVGYAGFFNAMPSIRGGEPTDLTAALDGFYIERPYHWGGGFSIFDPKMVKSARLSHGVFSSRYGHSISGLLEVSSRMPSPTEVELEAGISTSAASLDLSYPFNGKGGIMVMAKATYWDPFVWAAQKIMGLTGNEDLKKQLNSVKTAPYIRSGAVNANYRFSPGLEWKTSAFFGADGIGISLKDDHHEEKRIETFNDSRFEWTNYLGFLNTGLVINPLNTMVLKFSVGTGFIQSDLNAYTKTSGKVWYSPEFINNYDLLDGTEDSLISGRDYYEIPEEPEFNNMTNITFNAQSRLDLDWDLGRGFIFAAGAHELFSQWVHDEHDHGLYEEPPASFSPGNFIQSYPWDFNIHSRNRGFYSSAYTLIEYTGLNQRFGAELGLRADHLYFSGKGFSVQTMPDLNPRLNLDFGILQNRGFIDKLNLALGTGLFSSINPLLPFIDESFGIKDFDMKQNRSWTSVAGLTVDFSGGFVFSIEGYYKYIFNRGYMTSEVSPSSQEAIFCFDGEGRVWGFDLMLQKLESRYLDGWIVYSYSHARYRDPQNVVNGMYIGSSDPDTGGEWYYPSFHRFHNLNIVLNIKPTHTFNIGARLGFASGVLIPQTGEKKSYPVQLLDEDGNPEGGLIEKWQRDSEYKRTTPSIPLDLKFSFFRYNTKGKVLSEFYVAIENALALLYTSQGTTNFNSYTGEDDKGNFAAAYELPIPMASVGFKWSY